MPISVSTHEQPEPSPARYIFGTLLFAALGGGLATLGLWALMVPA